MAQESEAQSTLDGATADRITCGFCYGCRNPATHAVRDWDCETTVPACKVCYREYLSDHDDDRARRLKPSERWSR